MYTRLAVTGLVSALCAAFASVGAAQADRAEMVPVLRGLLKTYEGCILEKYETPQTAGLQVRDGGVTCLAGNPCSLASRQKAWRDLTAAANRGDDTNFSMNLQRAILADCMQCGKHAKWHTKHVHCTMDCGGNHSRPDPDGWGIGPCFEGCKAGVDITKWFAEIGRKIGEALGAVKPVEPQAQIGGATVAKNYRTVEDPPSESCEPTIVSRDFYIAPPSMLDWTPTVAPQSKITLIESLKALAIGTAIVGSAIVSFLGPLVSAGIVGGIGGIAMNGVPGSVIGLPGGPSPTEAKYNSSPGKNLGANEGRLRADLRAAAKGAAPLASLCKAAEYFALNDRSNGNAFADLSVTGRGAFAQFRQVRPQEDHIVPCLKTRASPKVRALPAERLRSAAAAALDRAYNVAGVLRASGWPKRCSNPRRSLGWIAVSGEDDQPHRPVNVPTTEFPQYDLAVNVKGKLTVNTRYMIAHARPPVKAPTCAIPTPKNRQMPVDPKPALAKDAEVILYVHGMDSSLEEAVDLTNALQKIAAKTGKNWTVISMDLPTSAYADNIDPERISPIGAIGEAKFRYHGAADLELTDLQVFDARGKHTVPIVDFIEDFIVAFVDKIEGVIPGVKARLRAVVGGSLGGNMSMRLGRRPDVSWIKTVVPWSPAAIWPSYADGNNPGNHLGVAMPWMWGGGDSRVRAEKDFGRRLFFYMAFDWTAGILKFKPQPQEWYRDGWEPSRPPGADCKAAHIVAARLTRQETYNQYFRLWHWRLAAEQLVFSHQGGAGAPRPLYLDNKTRMLLLCGYKDTGASLCEHTRAVARQMVNTPGKALFLKNTGHSIHNERPCWLASHIVEFLGYPIASCQ
jgi:pimeloyl-ACP methyl ester carboxylesterase